jgi:hypothetical protein
MSPRSAIIRIPQRRSYIPLAQKNNAGSSFCFSKVLEIISQKTTVLIFALAALLILAFWSAYETREIAKDIEILQTEESRLSAQYQDFSTQMEKLGKKMGLHPPTDSQIISLN